VNMVERRITERLPASLEARIAFGGRYRLRCMVLNISETGAKLVLDKSADVPAQFILSISCKRWSAARGRHTVAQTPRPRRKIETTAGN
jgi:hypothetical protein